MDITSFTLGVLFVVFAFNIAGAVYNLVMVYKLKKELISFNQILSDTANWFTNKTDNLSDKIETNDKEIVRMVDSRLDKLITRIEALELANGIIRNKKIN